MQKQSLSHTLSLVLLSLLAMGPTSGLGLEAVQPLMTETAPMAPKPEFSMDLISFVTWSKGDGPTGLVYASDLLYKRAIEPKNNINKYPVAAIRTAITTREAGPILKYAKAASGVLERKTAFEASFKPVANPTTLLALLAQRREALKLLEKTQAESFAALTAMTGINGTYLVFKDVPSAGPQIAQNIKSDADLFIALEAYNLKQDERRLQILVTPQAKAWLAGNLPGIVDKFKAATSQLYASVSNSIYTGSRSIIHQLGGAEGTVPEAQKLSHDFRSSDDSGARPEAKVLR